MRAHNASASRVWLLAECGYWAHRSVELPEEKPTLQSEHGVQVHAGVSAKILGKPFDGSPRVMHHVNLVLEWLKTNAPAILSSESALVYDVEGDKTEHRILENHREYGAISATQIPGSSDILYLDAAREAVVILDIKTGFHVTPIDESHQMLTLGLAGSRLYGVRKALVAHIRVSEDRAWGEWADYSEEALDKHRLVLRTLLPVVTGDAPPEPTPGPYCAWCPARTVCPKTEQMIVSLPRLGLVTMADAARIHQQLKPMRDLIDAIEDKIANEVRKQIDQTGAAQVNETYEFRFQSTGGGESVSLNEIPDDVADTLREIGVIKERKRGQRLVLAKVSKRR